MNRAIQGALIALIVCQALFAAHQIGGMDVSLVAQRLQAEQFILDRPPAFGTKIFASQPLDGRRLAIHHDEIGLPPGEETPDAVVQR